MESLMSECSEQEKDTLKWPCNVLFIQIFKSKNLRFDFERTENSGSLN